jgi:hypothetical protein
MTFDGCSMACRIPMSPTNSNLTESELNALQLALGDESLRQGLMAPELWRELTLRALVHRVKAIDDFDAEGKPIYEDPERSWFELTEGGCRTLNAMLGTSFDLSSCWVCGEESPSGDTDCLHTCSRCGAYAGDE